MHQPPHRTGAPAPHPGAYPPAAARPQTAHPGARPFPLGPGAPAPHPGGYPPAAAPHPHHPQPRYDQQPGATPSPKTRPGGIVAPPAPARVRRATRLPPSLSRRRRPFRLALAPPVSSFRTASPPLLPDSRSKPTIPPPLAQPPQAAHPIGAGKAPAAAPAPSAASSDAEDKRSASQKKRDRKKLREGGGK